MNPSTLTVDVNLAGETLDTVAAIAPAKQWQLWMHQWILHLAPTLSPINAYELSLQFTTDTAIAELNGQYRQQFQATDVLSFATLDDAPLPLEILQNVPFYLGDIVISLETAQRQCDEHRHGLAEELAWLAAHGLLHLLEWDHPDEAHLQKMLSTQRQLLAKIGMELASSEYSLEESPKTLF